MANERAPRPVKNELAILNPRARFHLFAAVAQECRDFWLAAERAADAAFDVNAHHIAYYFRFALDEGLAHDPETAPGWPTSPFAYEKNRRLALGYLGKAMLLRLLIQPRTGMADGELPNGTVPLFDGSVGENEIPSDYRVHVTPDAAEAVLPAIQSNNEWFQRGGLHIHRSFPAQPSDELTHQFGGHVDFSGLVTLRPFVGTSLITNVTAPTPMRPLPES